MLKGATLFLAWNGQSHRVTRDIDLLGYGDPAPERLAELFRLVATVPCDEDGVVFDPRSVQVSPIREEIEYGGVRVTMRARLDRADLPVQIDVGFGDAVQPVEMALPTILPLPAPRLRAYPPEVVVAEKLEAMVRLGRENTRLKDFYDVWPLLRSVPFDARLQQAIEATFARRGTVTSSKLSDALSDAFADDPVKQAQRAAFLRRAMTDERPPLSEVITVIRGALWPLFGGAGSRR